MKNESTGSILHPIARTKMTEMKVFLKGAALLMAAAAAFLCFSLFPQAAKAFGTYGTNLVVNGNAQANDTLMTGWTTSGTVFMVLTPSGYIPPPNSLDGGNVFDFFPTSPMSENIHQTIDISNLASDIDAGAVNIHVSAETRKYLSTSSNIVKLELLDVSYAPLATYQAAGTSVNSIWDTLTIDRNSILTGTRHVRITLSATVTDESYTDYVEFDGISLTLTKSITSASVSGIAAPETGKLPITYTSLIPGSSDYTVTGLTWQNWDGLPANYINSRFKASNTYRALIELTASPVCKFTSGDNILVNTGTPQPGTISGGDAAGNKLTFAVTFPATAPLAVTGISVTSQPSDLSYIGGEALKLNGASAMLTYNDTSTESVDSAQFDAKGIIASPSNGTLLTTALHSGNPVMLTCNGQAAYTNTLSVLPACYTVEASPLTMNFGSVVEGYSSAPASQTVTVTNTGNSSVTLITPVSSNYDITAVDSLTLAPLETARFGVQPKAGLAAGVYSGIITFNTTSLTNTIVNISFTVATPVYSITASPTSKNLGSMVEGSIVPSILETVTITNEGNTEVTINIPTSTDFTIIPMGPTSLLPGNMTWFRIQPKSGLAVGTHDETITFSTVDGASASVDVSFTVEAADYTVEADKDSLSFDSVIEGYMPAPVPQTVTIVNKGNTVVTINIPTSTNFDIVPFGPTILSPAGPTWFHVQPKTGLAAGTYNETITFLTTNGTSDSVNASFTVQAKSYTVEADTDSLNFLSVIEGYTAAPDAQTVTITNTGNSAVTFSAAPAASDYDIIGPFPVTVPAGSFFTFGVQPKTGLAAGPHNQTITLNTDRGTSASVDLAFAVNTATYTITASPSSLNFGSAIVGYPAAPAFQTVTVTNTGNSAVTISSAPMAAAYDITGTFPMTIMAGSTGTFNIQPKLGLAPGTHNWNIAIITNHSTSASINAAFTVNAATYTITASPLSLNFGSAIEGYPAAPASQTVTVTNTGNSAVTISSAPTAADYDIAGTFPMTLGAGGTDTFTVQPKLGLAAGAHNEAIVLNTNHGTSAGVDAAITVQTASYAVEADIHSVSFGSLIEGYAASPTAQTVAITNTGNKNVTLLTPVNASFDITALAPLTLAPSATARFSIQPKAGLSAGMFNEAIAFNTTSSTYDSVDVSFTVQPASFAITASPFTINFASAAEGYTLPAAETVTIVNTGNKPVTLVQPASTNFTAGTLSKLSIAPLEEAAFTLQPKIGLAEGIYAETVVLQGSNGASANVDVRFTVTAAPSYTIDASPSGLVFDSLAQGYIQPAVKYVTVTNTGNQSISLYQPTASHFEIGTLSKTNLVPLDTAAFTVTPKAGLLTGAWNETVHIQGSMGVNTQVDVAFTCTEPNDYVILSGDGSTFQQDEPEQSSLTITANGHLSNFTGLTLNGELVDESNYDVAEGSTIVTLHQDFLDTLTPGTYTLRFHYTDGFADAGFVVQDQMPVTGDNDTLILFGSLMVLSLAAIILLRRMKARR